MKLKKLNWIGIASGAVLIIIASVLIFTGSISVGIFIAGIGVAIAILPFILHIMFENKHEQQINEMFLEFTRNLAESVSTGTPISRSIVNMSHKNYGALTPHITKLANQISLGIPVNKAMITFAHDVDNPVISRAIGLISEAERAGGEIDYILDSVSHSIAEVEKLKKERKAAISTLTVQGYIIFFIFIAIMLVMQYKILPLAVQIGSISGLSSGGVSAITGGSAVEEGKNVLANQDIARLFLYLLLVQGLFSGLTIGKLAEGSVKAGIKHSFIMMISAFLISTGVTVLWNP